MNIDFITRRMITGCEAPAVVTDGTIYRLKDIYHEFQSALKVLEDNHIAGGSIVTLAGEFSPVSIAFLLALVERDAIIVPVSGAVKNIDEYMRISESQYLIDTKDSLTIKALHVQTQHPILKKLQDEQKPGLVLFSSGTTGEPKAAVHDLSILMEKFRKPGKCLSAITFLLFDHIGGFNTLMHSLASGGLIVTLRNRTPDEVCRLIERYRVELLPASPTFINMLLLSRLYEKYDLSSLKIISYGTEPMPQSTLKALHEIMPGVKLKQTYGLSELGIMPTRSESSDSLYIQLGGEGYETKITDGILWVRAKSAMLGYLNAPSPFDSEGWFNTQDKVEVKGDYIKILGRVSDIINVGGEKVYPSEVESVLLGADGVKDVRVYGEISPLTGQIAAAEVLVDPENDNRAFIRTLREYAKGHLEPFKRPASYKLTTGTLCGGRLKKKR